MVIIKVNKVLIADIPDLVKRIIKPKAIIRDLVVQDRAGNLTRTNPVMDLAGLITNVPIVEQKVTVSLTAINFILSQMIKMTKNSNPCHKYAMITTLTFFIKGQND